MARRRARRTEKKNQEKQEKGGGGGRRDVKMKQNITNCQVRNPPEFCSESHHGKETVGRNGSGGSSSGGIRR